MNISVLFLIIYTCICFVGTFIGLYGVFQKTGVKGWLALIPFYNLYVWLKVIERPWWWLLFFLIPYFFFFMLMLMTWKTIRMFNKTRYITLIPGTFFSFIYMSYLGFSSKEKFYKREELPAMELGFWNSKPLTTKRKNIKPENVDEKERSVKTKTREWTDAILYAVVAAYIIRTFWAEFYTIPTSSMEGTLMVGDYLAVSKIAYGPKIPQTPIAVPFVHHTIPFTQYTKSYWDKLQLPYLRLSGFHDIERYDVVVFNYPDGDTVALERQSESYYAIAREFEAIFKPNPSLDEQQRLQRRYSNESIINLRNKYKGSYYQGKGRDVVNQEYQVVARPVDKRENYVKRCVGISGDTMRMENAVLYVNGQPAFVPEKMQLQYLVVYKDFNLNDNAICKKCDINEEDKWITNGNRYDIFLNNEQTDTITKLIKKGYTVYVYCLYTEQIDKIRKLPNVLDVIPMLDKPDDYEFGIFPQDARYVWNKDNFGPIVIPQKGQTVHLNDSTIHLYKRIIKNYEGNDLEIKAGKIFINGQQADSYTFKQNYYWMMGDNRHNSLDSRYWGFVPEDHVVGKVSFAWLSLDKFKSWGEGKVRWKRMFRGIK